MFEARDSHLRADHRGDYRRRASGLDTNRTFRGRINRPGSTSTGRTDAPANGYWSRVGLKVGIVPVESYLLTASLTALCGLLTILSVRGLLHYRSSRTRSQLMWGSGLALAAAAMGVEAIVYAGYVTSPILQAYVFFSAAIVGVLSLGATKILRSPRLERIYTRYTLVSCALVGFACVLTPLPTSMVQAGIIAGNPPLLLIALSSLVTVPATVILLAATAVSLRRSWRWQSLLMAGGAVILGAGGTLYIASFPIALYYAEFLGILLLFLGIISLPQPSATSTGRPSTASTG
jgi:hypothetical protein